MSNFAKAARNNFMLLQVSVSTWSGSLLNRAAADRLALATPTVSVDGHTAGRYYVNLLGTHQHRLSAVQAEFTLLRTYIYKHTLPFSTNDGEQAKGERLVPVAKVQEVLRELNSLAAKANAAADKFCADYDSMLANARHELGSLLDDVEYKIPSAETVRAKFNAKVKPPRMLDVADPALMRSTIGAVGKLADDLIDTIAKAHDAEIERAVGGSIEAALTDSVSGVVPCLERFASSPRKPKPSTLVKLGEHADTLDALANGSRNPEGFKTWADQIRHDVIGNRSGRVASRVANSLKEYLADASAQDAGAVDFASADFEAIFTNSPGFAEEDF